MNTNESDFENELRALRPAATSHGLEHRIAAGIAAHAPTSGVLLRPAPRSLAARIVGGLGWAIAGAAAAVAALTWIPHWQKSAPPVVEAGDFQSGESERELVGATDEGVRYVEGEEPVRQVRYNYVVRHIWTNAATGARVEVEVPREDVFLMPVAMQ